MNNKPLPARIDDEFVFQFVDCEKIKVVLAPFENGDVVTCKVFTRASSNSEWKLAELSATSFIKEDYWERVRNYVMMKIYEFCLEV